MNWRLGLLSSCVVISYFVVRFLLTKDVSAQILYCVSAYILGKALNVMISKLFPIELLPDLHKKAILITGCDTGFGHLLAQRLDSLGVVVYASCLFPDGEGAKSLKQKCSDKLHILQLDVRNDKQVEDAAEYVKSTLGDKVLWAVVNNAGIATLGEFEWHSIETIHEVFDVNTYGQLRIAKAFLPLLRESKGRVVNVNSVAGYVTLPRFTPYCASKHAAVSFSSGLAGELQKFSISVHSIEPSFYRTDILNNLHSTKLWDECPNDIKDVYGRDFFDKMKPKLEWALYNIGLPSGQLSNVIDSMVEASIGVHTKDNYSPSLADTIAKALVVYLPINRLLRLFARLSEPVTPFQSSSRVAS